MAGIRTDGAMAEYESQGKGEREEFMLDYCDNCERRERECREKLKVNPFWRHNGKVGCLDYKSALKGS